MPKRFKTDCADLTGWLAKRASSLEGARQPHEPVWSELRIAFEPDFGRSVGGLVTDAEQAAARRDDKRMLNNSPRLALHKLAAGMQSGITSKARQWFRLAVESPALAERAAVRLWLDAVTAGLASMFSKSNLYTTTHLLYLHIGYCGNGCALALPDAENVMHTALLDEGTYWFAADKRDRVVTLLRKYSATADQIREEFGEEGLPGKVSACLGDGGRNETRFEVRHLIFPNDGRCGDIDRKRPFASVYWMEGCGEEDDAGVLDIRSFGYNPIIAPRWNVTAGVYGTGPGHMALGDAKELQKLEEDSLKALSQVTDPPMRAPAGTRVATYPGGVTYTGDQGRDDGRIGTLFDVRPDVKAAEFKIDQVSQRIGRAFYNDLIAMMLNMSMRPKQMTAREVNELSGEKMSLLGPVLTRMDSDMLDPIIDAGFYLLAEAGRLPPVPDELKGVELKVDYVSVLHVEQQATSRLGSMIKLADFVGIVAPMNPECVDKIDADQALDEAGSALAVPAGVLRDDKAVAVIRQTRADQAERARQAELQMRGVPGAARAVKDLSQTPMGGGSALDAAVAAAGGGGQ